MLIVTATPDVYAQGRHFIQRLAYAGEVKFADAAPADVSGMVTVTHNATAYRPQRAGGHRRGAGADPQGDRESPERPAGRRAEALQREVRLRAPEAVVNAEREKAAKYKELIAKLENRQGHAGVSPG